MLIGEEMVVQDKITVQLLQLTGVKTDILVVVVVEALLVIQPEAVESEAAPAA